MSIILSVAVITVFRGGFQSCDGALPGMAATTVHRSMFSRKAEGNRLVVKILPISIDAVMTGQACTAKC